MSKKLNTASITNELEGSAFFPSKKIPQVSPTPQPTAVEANTSDINKPTKEPNSKKAKIDAASEGNSQKDHQNASLLANQQTSKPVNKLASKLVNQQTSKEVNQQSSKLVSLQINPQPLLTKEKKKYGTYLREDSIFNIQVDALQTKRKDHEVLQEAVDFYFQNKK